MDTWVSLYASRRFGLNSSSSAYDPALHAYKLLQDSAYAASKGGFGQGAPGSVIAARPALSISGVSYSSTSLFYDPADVVHAWRELVAAGEVQPSLAARETFVYDLVVLGVQVLSNLALTLHAKAAAAMTAEDIDALEGNATEFLQVAHAADELLSTRRQFLLGNWIDAARQRATDGGIEPPTDGTCASTATQRRVCGTKGITADACEVLGCCFNSSTAGVPSCFEGPPLTEAQLYERSARTMVTLWGPQGSGLHEYAYRLWAGLVSDFHIPRWRTWFNDVIFALKGGMVFDQGAFDKKIQAWEEAWTRRSNDYPTEPIGDALTLSQQFLQQFQHLFPKPSECKSASELIPPSQRRNCPGAFSGISSEECVLLGCCFNSSTAGVPWCFVVPDNGIQLVVA